MSVGPTKGRQHKPWHVASVVFIFFAIGPLVVSGCAPQSEPSVVPLSTEAKPRGPRTEGPGCGTHIGEIYKSPKGYTVRLAEWVCPCDAEKIAYETSGLDPQQFIDSRQSLAYARVEYWNPTKKKIKFTPYPMNLMGLNDELFPCLRYTSQPDEIWPNQFYSVGVFFHVPATATKDDLAIILSEPNEEIVVAEIDGPVGKTPPAD